MTDANKNREKSKQITDTMNKHLKNNDSCMFAAMEWKKLAETNHIGAKEQRKHKQNAAKFVSWYAKQSKKKKNGAYQEWKSMNIPYFFFLILEQHHFATQLHRINHSGAGQRKSCQLSALHTASEKQRKSKQTTSVVSKRRKNNDHDLSCSNWNEKKRRNGT